MPPSRRFRRKRRRMAKRKRDRYARGGDNQLQKRVRRTPSYVPPLSMFRLTGERMYTDTSKASTDVQSTWGNFDPSVTTSVCTVAQGDGPSARTGNRIVVKRVLIHYHLITASEDFLGQAIPTFMGILVRVVVIQDKRVNGAKFTPAQPFTATGPHDELAFQDPQYMSRYKILYDRVHEIKPVQVTTASTVASGLWDIAVFGGVQRGFVDLKLNMPVEYSQTAGVIANVTNNNISILAVDNQTGITTQIGYEARSYFDG